MPGPGFRIHLSAVSIAISLALTALAAARDLAVDPPFGSHMVLPAESTVRISGSSGQAGSVVAIHFAGRTVTTTVDAHRHWVGEISTGPASMEVRRLVVESGTDSVIHENLLVGEIWMASGQSNMAFPLTSATGGKQAAEEATIPGVRLCHFLPPPTTNRAWDQATRTDAQMGKLMTGGKWEVSNPASAGRFSAIAWWFARERHRRTGIPIGIIGNAVGGCGTEAWLDLEALPERDPLCVLRDGDWLTNPRISDWARGRARVNLAPDFDLPHPYRPGILHHKAIVPWRGFPLRGVLWYQGETNAESPDKDWNRHLLESMITGWRKSLDQPDLPFYLIELPRIGGQDPLRRHWPEYREVQASVAQRLPHVTLVPTTDLGYNSPDVHPPDKYPIARRLESMAAGAEP